MVSSAAASTGRFGSRVSPKEVVRKAERLLPLTASPRGVAAVILRDASPGENDFRGAFCACFASDCFVDTLSTAA